MFFSLAIMSVAVIIAATKGLVNVPQAHRAVVERMGVYHCTLEAGWHVTVPFVDAVVRRFDLGETAYVCRPEAITKDAVAVSIDVIAHYQITDVKAATYRVAGIGQAMESVIATSLQRAISDVTLNQVLGRHDPLGSGAQDALDAATDRWGLKVTRVEIREIMPMDGN